MYTPHSTLRTLHFARYTFHSTLQTLHFTLDTPNFTLDALHFTLYTLSFTLYPLRSTLYSLHCALPPQQSISTPYCHDPQPTDSSSTRSPNHLQHLWNCYPCFAILHYPFLSITSHPLANSLVPNPYERCSPLSHFTLHSPPTTVTFQPPTVMILSPLVHRLPEAQTICSTFGIVVLALQSFATPSSVSLLIPLQTLLFRTPMNAALRWATLHCTVPHNSPSPPPTVMILSPLVHRLLEAQTICSTFGIVILALQPFATPSSVSLLIPLQVKDCILLHFLYATLHTPYPTPNRRCSLLRFKNPPFSSLALLTAHFTLHTAHLTLHTLRSTLSTSYSTLYTPYFTLDTNEDFALHTPHSTRYTFHTALDTLHSSLSTPDFSLNTLNSSLLTPHCTLYTPHSTL